MNKDHMRMLMLLLTILQSMSEFGGLWKRQYKPACTKSVTVFLILNLDTMEITKEEEVIDLLKVSGGNIRNFCLHESDSEQRTNKTEQKYLPFLQTV